jgi:glucosylceramidase
MNDYLGGVNCLSSTTTTPTTPSGVDFFELKSGLSTSSQSWCLDLARSDTTNGTPILFWPCNGGPNQQWTIDSEGYIRSQIDTNKCLVTHGAVLVAGTNFMIWDCFLDYPAMQWLWFADSSIRPRNAQDQCIDVRGDAVASQGAIIQLDNCGTGSDDQVWTELF